MARRVMLENAADARAQGDETGDEAGAELAFYSALARQCFINEYVFFHTTRNSSGPPICAMRW